MLLVQTQRIGEGGFKQIYKSIRKRCIWFKKGEMVEVASKFIAICLMLNWSLENLKSSQEWNNCQSHTDIFLKKKYNCKELFKTKKIIFCKRTIWKMFEMHLCFLVIDNLENITGILLIILTLMDELMCFRYQSYFWGSKTIIGKKNE